MYVMELLYRRIGDFISYIGYIGDIGDSNTPGIHLFSEGAWRLIANGLGQEV